MAEGTARRSGHACAFEPYDFLCFVRQNADHFTLDSTALEDGKGKCPYDPAKGHTGLIVGESFREHVPS